MMTIAQQALPWLAAGALAWAIYYLFQNIRVEQGTNRSLRHYQRNRPAELTEQLGEQMLTKLPFSWTTWEGHLRWAQRGGHYPGQRLGHLLGMSLLYALGSLLVLVLNPAPVFLFVPVLAFFYPLLAMRSKATRVKRQLGRTLPEIAALVAAEVAAENTPEQALMRSRSLPGPFAALLEEVSLHMSATGLPLFSRKPIKGALVEVLQGTDLPALRAFGAQLDLVARQGVDQAALMNDLARGLAREYHERVMVEKEQLGGKLTTRVAFFFFFPTVAILLMAFLIPMIQMF